MQLTFHATLAIKEPFRECSAITLDTSLPIPSSSGGGIDSPSL